MEREGLRGGIGAGGGRGDLYQKGKGRRWGRVRGLVLRGKKEIV